MVLFSHICGAGPLVRYDMNDYSVPTAYAAIRGICDCGPVLFGTRPAVICGKSLDFSAVPSIAWCHTQRR